MKDERKPSTKSANQFKFEKDREDWTDREILLANLFYLQTITDRTERTRANTSTMVWFLIALPIIFGVLIIFGTGLLAAL